MKTVYADISQGKELLFSNIQVYLEHLIEEDSGFEEWYGYFVLPSSQYIELGGRYRLSIKDGRTGNFLVSKVIMKSGHLNQNTAYFVGDGVLR